MKIAPVLKSKWWLLLIVSGVILGGYWLLPIDGQVIISSKRNPGLVWPTIVMNPTDPEPDRLVTVTVSDDKPWSFVLLLVNDTPALSTGDAVEHAGVWTWKWTFTASESSTYRITFYHDCHTGCVKRGEVLYGETLLTERAPGVPTKLGLVMADPARDWHQRSGWAVEITYAMHAEDPYWGVDDLASRINKHAAAGLRVLVRVDYTTQQSVPPEGDYLALTEYLAYIRRLARDDRLTDIYGFIIGNDFNAAEVSQLGAGQPVSPEWYARVFNGYGEDPSHQDNVVQVIRQENALARVLVGPVRPWISDANGELRYTIDVPWLNYYNTLVAALEESTLSKAASGIPLANPDGFDIQAPGSPDALEMAGYLASDEPRVLLPRSSWSGAQAGFRVYEDWLSIINGYSTTRGLPVYIVSTNTYNRTANIPPAQNYPGGWITSAFDVVNNESQIVALCWFLDSFPHSDQWDWFSLSEHPGRLVDAAEEFDRLLQLP